MQIRRPFAAALHKAEACKFTCCTHTYTHTHTIRIILMQEHTETREDLLGSRTRIYVFILLCIYARVPLCEYNIILLYYVVMEEATGQGLSCVFVPLRRIALSSEPIEKSSGKSSSLRRRRNPQNRDDSPQQSSRENAYSYTLLKAITLIRTLRRDLFRLFFYIFLGTVYVYCILTRGDNAKTLFFQKKHWPRDWCSKLWHRTILYFARSLL